MKKKYIEKNISIIILIIINLLSFTVMSCSKQVNMQLNTLSTVTKAAKETTIKTTQKKAEISLTTRKPVKVNKNLLNRKNQTVSMQPILLQPVKFDANMPFKILKNHPTEFFNSNTSFEGIYYLKDYFSDKNGFRPFPWGKEIFAGSPEFLCDNTLSRSGKLSFKIIGKNKFDDGALAIPNINLKPKVIPRRYYYLSFYINYNIYNGAGIRLIQQFFRKDDFKNKKMGTIIYPSYACYGPWITGTSNGKWIKYSLTVKAPDDAILGDPVIALLGVGSVNIDDVCFGEIKFLKFLSLT
ncbi:MAG: hypothetical protein M1326_04280 [Cyanobacteria bacterium]|nr:hypothetical protein [Cyanobacteriota bacterium]